jgi:hypothetical protein
MLLNTIIIFIISFILMSVITSPQFLIPRVYLYIFYIVALSFVPRNTYDNMKSTNQYQDAILLSLGVTTLVLLTELIIRSDALANPVLLLGILIFLFVKNVFFIRYVLQKIETIYGTKHFLDIKRFHKLNPKH